MLIENKTTGIFAQLEDSAKVGVRAFRTLYSAVCSWCG